MSRVTAAEAARRIEALHDALERGQEIRESFAARMVAEAVQRAARRPSPQARMASSGIEARGPAIHGPSESLVRSTRGRLVRLGDVLGGSEFGSSEYVQFGPRSGGGKWLWPAADDPAVLAAVESEAIDPLLEDAAR